MLHLFLSSYSGCQLLNNLRLGMPPWYLNAEMDLHLHIFVRSLKPDRNSLPDDFQSITNLDVFKVKIKQHFLGYFWKTKFSIFDIVN